MGKYKLVKPEVKQKTFKVFMTADANDGDYLTSTQTFTEKEFDEVVDELLDLKNNYLKVAHAFEEFCSEVELDIPYDGQSDYGCHTLEELEITCVDVDGIIYNVELQN